MRWTWVNNEFVEESKAMIHINDLAVQRGYGVFDFFRTREYKPLFIKEHLNRFFQSAQLMRLPIWLEKEQIEKIVLQLIEKNNIPESGIKLTLTGGYSADGYSPAAPNFIIQQQALSVTSEERFFKGLKLITHSHQRELPQVKSINYLMGVWLQKEIADNGADDVLFYTSDIITELPRANIFMVNEDDVLVTPTHNILQGVTRKHVLQLASDCMKVEERNVSLKELKNASEIFITSTTKRILPVFEIDRENVGANYPGRHTIFLHRKFIEMEEGLLESSSNT